jgi:DNA topoisomerase-3
MRVYIAEKPELAKAIAEGIASISGDEIRKLDGFFTVGTSRVTWCIGHLLALCEPKDYDPRFEKWSMEHLPIITIPWRYKPIPGTKKQLETVLRLIKEAGELVHAGDPDSEGQLLVDEVLTYAKNTKPVKRLLINDNNIELVRKALQSMKSNTDFAGQSNAALARSVADQLYGFNLSRAYTLAAQAKGLQENLSVGRVQTPILGLVVRRELEIENHSEKVRWVPRGVFAFGDWQVSAPIDCEPEASFEPLVISKMIQDCTKAPAVITSVDTVRKLEQPPLPHNLLTLQSEAHKKHGINPDRTLQITQDLRDKHRLITYNRSDCQYLSDEHHPEASQVLAAVAKGLPAFAQKVHSCNPDHKSRAFNSANVSAHHAIIPTKAVAQALTDEEQKIYRLVAEGYVLQFLSPYVYDSTCISIESNGLRFKTTIRCVVDGGWRAVLQEHSLPEDKQTWPKSFNRGASGICTSILTDVHKSKPSPRYTLATLLEELCKVARHVTDPEIKKLLLQKDEDKKGEHGGIGTPATRASIIKSLFDRGYLTEKGK